MFKIIDKNKELRELCKNIKENVDVLALDTEFMRKYTYFPSLCLIQISFYNKEKELENFIIDPLATSINLNPFLSILKNKKIKKIIHSSSQDVDAFYFINKTKISNLEDTQVMIEFCGKHSLSYVNSLKEFINVDLTKNKSIQTSNWKKRPLSKKQIKYAVNDTVYLLNLYDSLKEKLIENKNYEYYQNEMKHLFQKHDKTYTIENSWKKMKFLIHRESVLTLILIKELCKWREQKAIEENIIRTSILEDDLLLDIARKQPKELKEFKSLFFSEKQILNMPKSYRNEIINIIINYRKEYKDIDNNEIFYMKEKQFPFKDKLLLIEEKIKIIAEQHNILLSRVITQHEIIALIMKYDLKRKILYGWKYKLFSKAIYKLLK